MRNSPYVSHAVVWKVFLGIWTTVTWNRNKVVLNNVDKNLIFRFFSCLFNSLQCVYTHTRSHKNLLQHENHYSIIYAKQIVYSNNNNVYVYTISFISAIEFLYSTFNIIFSCSLTLLHILNLSGVCVVYTLLGRTKTPHTYKYIQFICGIR